MVEQLLTTRPRARRWRSPRRAITYRLARIATLVALVFSFLDALYVSHRWTAPTIEPPPLGNERIYIASIHWTTELILRSHLNKAVLDLARAIGPNNVFVSIGESGSLDNTKGALSILDVELEAAGIPRKILLDPTTHLDVVSDSWYNPHSCNISPMERSLRLITETRVCYIC